MTSLINNAVNCEKLNIPSTISAEEGETLFNFSKFHDVAHLVGNQLFKQNVQMPEDIKRKFQQVQAVAVYRYEQLNYEQKKIYECFEKAKIDFLPLKGTVVRELYPESWLRTSCDIDILVANNDLEKATEFLLNLGYEKKIRTTNEITFYSQSRVCLELHFVLLESGALDIGDELLQNVWEFTSSAYENSCQKLFTDEMFYYYHIVHMAKHFMYGGCGVKPFIDLFILNQKIKYDNKKRNDLLKKGGLLTFAEQAENLSNVWFNKLEHTALTKQMEDYVLDGGVYGSNKNKLTLQRARRGGKNKYIKSRFFMPYAQLKGQYPRLEKHKWLLPFYQVKRWFRVLKKGRFNLFKEEMDNVSRIKSTDEEQSQVMLKALKLTK